jgi:predicted phosphoribosyltransferase
MSDSLTNEACSPDGWCLTSGFRFKLAAVCTERRYQEYVLVAVPVSANTGTRNFCSTSDGVIRTKLGAPWEAALTASDCKRWPPIQ